MFYSPLTLYVYFLFYFIFFFEKVFVHFWRVHLSEEFECPIVYRLENLQDQEKLTGQAATISSPLS